MEDEQHSFKVLLVGDSGVGKTNILERFLVNRHNPHVNPTSHAECHSHKVRVGRRKVDTEIWDTPGGSQHIGMMSSLYEEAMGVMLVYDVTCAQSFQNITEWLEDMREEVDDRDIPCVPMLVGNKCDMDKHRAFPVMEAEAFAERHGLLFMEISALQGTDVDFAFRTLLNHCCRWSQNSSDEWSGESLDSGSIRTRSVRSGSIRSTSTRSTTTYYY